MAQEKDDEGSGKSVEDRLFLLERVSVFMHLDRRHTVRDIVAEIGMPRLF